MSARGQRARLASSILLGALVMSCGSVVEPDASSQAGASNAAVPTSAPASKSNLAAPAPGQVPAPGKEPHAGAAPAAEPKPAVIAAPGQAAAPRERPVAAPAPSRPGEPGSPVEGSGGGGPRPGAPYDIEPFDNVDGPLDGFRASVDARCGSTRGPECLIIVEQITVDDSEQECTVKSISYDPPEKNRKLQRGTTVTAVISCPSDSQSSGSDGSEG